MTIRWLRQLLGRDAPLCICLRQSPDWRGTPRAQLIEDSRAFCRLVGGPTGLHENFIADIVEVWDQTFALPFFQVRALLKDIARENLRTVEGCECVPLRAHAPIATPHAQLYLFIDDDDWLHPHFWRHFRTHLSEAIDGYVFGNILCTATIQLRALADGCYTNNYAVAAHALRQHADPTSAFGQHWDANRSFHTPPFRLAQVPLYLSATNKHPASAMKLKDGLQGERPAAARLRQLVERYVDESAQAILPEQAQWIATCREQTRVLFAAVLAR
jgi:hypothetical protein